MATTKNKETLKDQVARLKRENKALKKEIKGLNIALFDEKDKTNAYYQLAKHNATTEHWMGKKINAYESEIDAEIQKLSEKLCSLINMRDSGLELATIKASELKKAKAAEKAEGFKKAVRDYLLDDVSRLDFSAAKILSNGALGLRKEGYGYKSDSTRMKLINEVKREFKTD